MDQTTSRNNYQQQHSNKSIKVVAAYQLKSGDIQIFTSTTTEALQLRENKAWLKGLGDHAELIVPTYGVIAHGISTNSMNMKNQEATIQQLLADNYTVIPSAKISYVGWLTKESTQKRASSIVVEFTDPAMANAIIYAGMAWDGRIHQCQLYDRACRVKQCFRCYNYGHIGTQCNASQVCGYCAERHETKHCRQKGTEGFVPRCTVCKDTHTAWSNACPARRKEMQRVELAKQARSIYWHVPLKENDKTLAKRNTRITTNNNRRTWIQAPSGPIETTNRSFEAANIEPGPSTPMIEETADEAHTMQTPAALSTVEVWETPPVQQDSPQQNEIVVDPQLENIEETHLPARDTSDDQVESFSYPMEGIEGLTMQEADEWLESMANNDNPWPHDPGEAGPSPPTSMATDTRVASGKIYKGCRCPSHQDIYNDWPLQDAELTIAQCMRICVYCGRDSPIAAELRKHMRRKYAGKNISVTFETRGKWSSATPSWVRKDRPRDPNHQDDARMTRSQSVINSTNQTLSA